MNAQQQNAIDILQRKLLTERKVTVSLPRQGENEDGYAFTEVDGVTVMIGRQGGCKVPAVRTYRMKGLDAAVHARALWDQQKEWDDTNPTEALARKTGHLSPRVNKDLRCGRKDCPCGSENSARLRNRSLG